MSVRLLLVVATADGRRWYVGARTGEVAAWVDNHRVQVPIRDLELAKVHGEVTVESIKWVVDEEMSDGDEEDTGRAEHDTGAKRPVDTAGTGTVGRRRGDAACDERADRVDDARTHGTTAGTVRQPGPA